MAQTAGSTLVLQSSSYGVNEDSLATGTATWFSKTATNLGLVVGSSTHPSGSAVCTNYTVATTTGGYKITANYEGSETTWDSNSASSTSNNTITVSVSMREEPIETHPDFQTWAGTPSNPTGYAIFDDDGQFVGWDADKFKSAQVVDNQNMVGVTSYMVPTFNASVSYKSKTIPTLTDTYSIGGARGLPALPGYREWMCVGSSFSQLSDGTYDVSAEYLSSGDRGWNRAIYGDTDDD